jgi:hypothetical protein
MVPAGGEARHASPALQLWTTPGLVWLTVMLLNIVVPTGITSPKAALFNYDWMTLLVIALIVVVGAVYFLAARPARRLRVMTPQATRAPS